MITSKLISIPNAEHISTEYIENELKKQNIEPLRWAIVKTDSKNLTISLAFEK